MPKRKAAEASTEGPSTRATRSSTRTSAKTETKLSAKANTTTTKPRAPKSSTKKTKGDGADDDQDAEPPAKRAKTTKAKAAPKTTKARKSSTSTQSRDEATEDEPVKAKLAPTTEVDANGTINWEPYSAARALTLFENYADDDDPSAIGPAGLENLCNDAKIPMEGAMPLILAWQLNAEEMGKFTKDEWVKGTSKLKISSLPVLFTALCDLENLLILNNAPIKSTTKTDPYNREIYINYASDIPGSFQTLYMFCFNLAKPKYGGDPVPVIPFSLAQLNIFIQTSSALWSVLLAPKYPAMQEVIEFINGKGDVYKASNKDLWTMMLEFCRTVKPDLQDYESEGAWPTLLDDFVASKSS
ncbi:hypothetical protein D9757_007207 [Collybiopsis confluens]|uniref:Defective in cullin neddylation protein n=1 Tax=Collybiopsis confluens TaxID=2823264 RepID=A0A8H5M404_9AGAR|nr:hypothetical protein D9757_007207 [Collybiopsis confluens]